MRLVFAGTPEPAVESLRTLIDSQHEVVAVVTRPDAPTGRGRRLERSPVGQVADESGIELLTPAKANDPDFVARLKELAPDACPVVAYGALLKPEVLAIPKFGWINLHFSLLPAWRGAAPVQHAIWHGDEITGATTFQLDEGMDTGPVFGTVTQAVGPTTTSGDLLATLAHTGAQLLRQTLDGIEAGRVVAVAQPVDGISYASKIEVADAKINWSDPAIAIDRMIRACTPAPGAWTELGEDRLKLGPVGISGEHQLPAGEVLVTKRNVFVGTATQAVELGTVRAPGKREMPAADWARGARLESGAILG